MPYPQGCIGTVVDPKTRRKILIYPKKGESKQKAIDRVKSKHGITDSTDKGEPEKKEEQTKTS